VLLAKSILLGFAFVVLTAILVVFVAMVMLFFAARSSAADGGAIGWDPVSWMRQSIIPWLILAAGFVSGFLMGLKRFAG
jgi:hypothetical protein